MALASCPLCRGTGWKTVSHPSGVGKFAVRCECTTTADAARLLRQARVPCRYEHCDFENFETELWADETGDAQLDLSLKSARLVAQAFARDFPARTDAGLLLMGPCGVGKTHLAVAALKDIILRGHSALFYDYRELLKEIQSSYNPENQSSEMQILEPVLDSELLLLDDLGANKPSAWALETVGHILNARYNGKRITLITTNYLDSAVFPAAGPVLPSGRAVAPHREETLADRVGLRIRSRLYEMCRTVMMNGKDFRREVRQANRFPA